MDHLDDIDVIEIGSTVVGPYATQALGALGADVVKVEPPGGDPFRGDDPEDVRTYFGMCNAGKRSLRLDLKQEAGREAFLELASHADVVVENFRPGVVDRLGVGYDDVAAVADEVVYCSISGFGEDSATSERAIFDPMLQGLTGLMATTGEQGGDPVRIGVALIDLVTGIWSAVAVLGALRRRDRTGKGSFVDMRMYDVGVSLLTKKAARYFDTGEEPARMGLASAGSHPYTGYPTADDEIVVVGAPHPGHWPRFCRAVDREDLIDDERFATGEDRKARREELNEILEAEFRQRTRDAWEERFMEQRLPVGPIRSVGEAVDSEFTRENQVRATVDHPDYGSVETLNLPLVFDGERHRFDDPPPLTGEHSREVLAELGLSADEIDDMAADGVI